MPSEIHAVPLQNPNFSYCTQCKKEIPEIHMQAVEKSGYLICIDCRTCTTCNMIVTDVELGLSISSNLPIQHARCRQKTNPICKIPVDQNELHVLNLCRLMIVPDCDLSTDANKKRAELAQQQLWETFTIEQKYHHTQMMESVYSACYLALKKDPSEVKAKLLERDRERTVRAHKEAEKDRRLSLPSERKKQSTQDMFLAGMLKSGITKEMAIEIWKSKGKVWVE